MTTPKVDVLVVTALRLERQAVRIHLTDLQVENETNLSADIGTNRWKPDQRIAIIETGPGNIDAAILTAIAEEKLRPTYVVMFGIAGGVKDVAIGDVVASRKVYWVEGGKETANMLRPRPDFAPVSGTLVQRVRAVAADSKWLERGAEGSGAWPAAERGPEAHVAPIVVGETVVGSRNAETAKLIAATYSDAVAVDMEDFGALRGGAVAERAKVIAIRAISDLLTGKTNADKDGSQQLAVANGAAFLFEVLDCLSTATVGTVDEGAPTSLRSSSATSRPVANADTSAAGASGSRADAICATGRVLYPAGPEQDGLWERAGGDPSRLDPDGTGATRWWKAVKLIEKGGGGAIDFDSLLAQMRGDYPANQQLGGLD